jgi:hypothetical protein
MLKFLANICNSLLSLGRLIKLKSSLMLNIKYLQRITKE